MGLNSRIIVYDGKRHLCNQWLRLLPPRDPQRRYSFCPVQRQRGAG